MSSPLAPLLLATAATAGLLAAPADATAAAAAPAPARAFPATGATQVSPQSSIYVGAPTTPTALALEVNGQAMAAGALDPLGPGSGGAWWRLRGPLAPGASYVVRGMVHGITRELTRFTTASSHDTVPGTPSTSTRLRLWRVRYPQDQVGRGGVSSEYQGYVDVAYQPGTVPGTPDAEVLTMVTLSPKGGGAAQVFVYPGRDRMPLAIWENYYPNRFEDVPDGRIPHAKYSAWRVALDPDGEYCATVTLHGRNDLASPPLTSAPICAAVMNVAAPGLPDAGPDVAPAPPPDGGADGHVAVAPDGSPSADAGADRSAPPPNADPSPDTSPPPAADAGPATTGAATAATAATAGDGCSVGRGAPAAPWLALFGLAFALRRRRRKRR